MEFRTTIKPLKNQGIINHQKTIMLLGSCFSDNIGARLNSDLFNVDINPFGTLYNPASIASAIKRIISDNEFIADELFEHEHRYHSFAHHSRFSTTNINTTLQQINTRLHSAHETIKSANMLLITFGTAWVYQLKATNQIVSNCHKLPATLFSRTRLSVNDIVEEWTTLLEKLYSINSQLNVIFTVSPIRHLADGAHDNQLSKSTLLLAIDHLGGNYFPSYEIMLDDLRDYRFYSADMTHPSDVAIDYIYDIFSQSYMTDATRELARSCRRISQRLSHRPMTDNISAIESFNSSTKQIINSLLLSHPYLKKAINNLLLQ